MAKNYATYYNSPNDSISLEQRFYLKVESVRGTLAAPGNSDYFWILPGSSITFNQPFDPSMVRSGRHNDSFIKKKKEMSFSLKTYFNIDLSLSSAGVAEIDQANRTLFKSLFGKEDITSGSPVYNSSQAPDITFSLYEVGDRWSRQARGCFIQDGNLNFPGDGEATIEWTGAGKDALFAGIAKSVNANALGNIFHGSAGDGNHFQVGCIVMIVKADGVTRSTDTATYRTITAISGDDITLDGSPLTTDSDGTALAPSYLVYFEPSAPAAINQPVTGLVGTALIAGLPTNQGIRQVMIKVANNHEVSNYYYGQDSLAYPFFVPASRLSIMVTVEMNLNQALIGFFNRVQGFASQALDFTLGDSAGRRLHVVVPKIQFPVPTWTVPDTGSIPITFEGTAYETSLDAADEITVSFI